MIIIQVRIRTDARGTKLRRRASDRSAILTSIFQRVTNITEGGCQCQKTELDIWSNEKKSLTVNMKKKDITDTLFGTAQKKAFFSVSNLTSDARVVFTKKKSWEQRDLF